MDPLGQGGRGDHHVEELLPEQHLGRVPHLGVIPRVMPRDAVLHGALTQEEVIGRRSHWQKKKSLTEEEVIDRRRSHWQKKESLAEEEVIGNSRSRSNEYLEEGLGGGEVVVDVLGVVIAEGVPGHQRVLGELSEHRVQLDLESDQD